MKKEDCIHSFINTLNHILHKDEEALRKLLLTHVETKSNYEKDEKVIGGTSLSALGILNSCLNNFCGERISLELDDVPTNESAEGFKIIRVEKWNPK